MERSPAEVLRLPRDIEGGNSRTGIAEQLDHGPLGLAVKGLAGVLPCAGNFPLEGDVAGVDVGSDVVNADAERAFFHDGPEVRILAPRVRQEARMQVERHLLAER